MLSRGLSILVLSFSSSHPVYTLIKRRVLPLHTRPFYDSFLPFLFSLYHGRHTPYKELPEACCTAPDYRKRMEDVILHDDNSFVIYCPPSQLGVSHSSPPKASSGPAQIIAIARILCAVRSRSKHAEAEAVDWVSCAAASLPYIIHPILSRLSCSTNQYQCIPMGSGSRSCRRFIIAKA